MKGGRKETWEGRRHGREGAMEGRGHGGEEPWRGGAMEGRSQGLTFDQGLRVAVTQLTNQVVEETRRTRQTTSLLLGVRMETQEGPLRRGGKEGRLRAAAAAGTAPRACSSRSWGGAGRSSGSGSRRQDAVRRSSRPMRHSSSVVSPGERAASTRPTKGRIRGTRRGGILETTALKSWSNTSSLDQQRAETSEPDQ
ncbi:hypothetical protein EYF80_064448 [Liparis tanakae]|uniref:Uncharacterized protein n=1 Tax=Liparis tanakae TaxID=230148 RepID=A0A4Z2EA59_9TELE|nr:hypothetical protein EYF80_064448 [Liparis tanakae]